MKGINKELVDCTGCATTYSIAILLYSILAGPTLDGMRRRASAGVCQCDSDAYARSARRTTTIVYANGPAEVR
jgi:hypothetical protein